MSEGKKGDGEEDLFERERKIQLREGDSIEREREIYRDREKEKYIYI